MRFWIFVAAVNGLIAVLMGAAGSHILAGQVDPERMTFIQLGFNYQLWHALGLLGVGLLTPHVKPGKGTRLVRASGVAFTFGIIFFSGGLYMLALMGPGITHWVVPLGGSLLITGWIGLSVSAFFIEGTRRRVRRSGPRRSPPPAAPEPGAGQPEPASARMREDHDHGRP